MTSRATIRCVTLSCCRALQAMGNPQGRRFSRRAATGNTMHKCITAVRSLPMELRLKSRRWLEERGLEALDDGDV